MTTSNGLCGIICHDDVAMQRAVGVIMERIGFDPVTVVEGFGEDTLAVATSSQPDAVVFDLALSGDYGLRLIPALREASPGCVVVALSSLGGLRERARDAGAIGLVDPRDLRHVDDCLRVGLDPSHPCHWPPDE